MGATTEARPPGTTCTKYRSFYIFRDSVGFFLFFLAPLSLFLKTMIFYLAVFFNTEEEEEEEEEVKYKKKAAATPPPPDNIGQL